MKRFDFTGYQVIQSYDRDSHTVAYTSNEETAKKIMTHKDANYRSVAKCTKSFTVFESYEEYIDTVISPAKLREQALAKLTPLEIKALGLN